MSSWTLSFIAGLEPSSCGTDAESVRSTARSVRTYVDQVASARRTMGEAWSGGAADAAQARMSQHLSLGDDIAVVLDRVVDELDAAVATLDGARQGVVSAVESARAEGCSVADDGSVTPPPVPPITYSSDASASQVATWTQERDARVAAAQARAELHAAKIGSAIDFLRLADEVVANRLHGISVPSEVSATALETIAAVSGAGAMDPGALPLTFGDDWTLMDNLVDMNAGDWVNALQSPDMCLLVEPTPRDAHDQLFTGYMGGGAVRGPDGELYPLVVPRYYDEGAPNDGWGSSVEGSGPRPEDLGGADDGWFVVGRTAGTSTTQPLATWEKIAIGASGFMGTTSVGDDPRFDLRGALAVDDNGFPRLADAESTAGPGKPFADPRDNPTNTPVSAPGFDPSRTGRVGGAIDVVSGAANSATLLREVDGGEDSRFVLTLEENEDGRRRALMRTYEVFEGVDDKTGDPEFTIQSRYGFLDEEGDFRESNYNIRGSQDVEAPAGVTYRQW